MESKSQRKDRGSSTDGEVKMWNRNSKRILELEQENKILKENFTNLDSQISALKLIKSENLSVSTQEFANRIADLEIKMSKIWVAVIRFDERKQSASLTSSGKKFLGGMSKAVLEKR